MCVVHSYGLRSNYPSAGRVREVLPSEATIVLCPILSLSIATQLKFKLC